MTKMISWFTPPIGAKSGYGYAAVETIRSIQRLGVLVKYRSPDPYVYINFVQPNWYDGHPDQYRIGYTPWESTDVPPDWHQHFKTQNEIWTTSNFCKEVFEEAGVVPQPIRVVPHGIDPEVWTIENREVADCFTFLHVGGPTFRKGGQRVVNAFIDLFDGKEDVQLILKSIGPTEARWRKGETYMGSAAEHPQIINLTTEVSTDDLARLYKSAHCMVYPTNGEGFGLIPFQGIATGLPTICTNALGCADFAGLSEPLEWSWGKGTGIHIGRWAEPSEDDLRDKMLYVYENYQDAKYKAINGARIIHNTQTWDHIAKDIIDHLGDKVEKSF